MAQKAPAIGGAFRAADATMESHAIEGGDCSGKLKGTNMFPSIKCSF